MTFDEFCNDNGIFDNERKAFREFAATDLLISEEMVDSQDIEEGALEEMYDEFSDDVLDSDDDDEEEN